MSESSYLNDAFRQGKRYGLLLGQQQIVEELVPVIEVALKERWTSEQVIVELGDAIRRMLVALRAKATEPNLMDGPPSTPAAAHADV